LKALLWWIITRFCNICNKNIFNQHRFKFNYDRVNYVPLYSLVYTRRISSKCLIAFRQYFSLTTKVYLYFDKKNINFHFNSFMTLNNTLLILNLAIAWISIVHFPSIIILNCLMYKSIILLSMLNGAHYFIWNK